MSDQSIQMVWDKTLIYFHCENISRLLSMRCFPFNPQALLLVQGTGGGKSEVVQTVGSIDSGVTLVIVENLDVAANQRSKVVSANGVYGSVLAYPLYPVNQKHLEKHSEQKLLSIEPDSNTTIFLYTSSRYLNREPWSSLMVQFINRRVLKLVVIDEIHLFVVFGTDFGKEFMLLKKAFFRYLLTEKDPGIPILFDYVTTSRYNCY